MRTWQRIREPFYTRHSHDCAYAAVVLGGSYEEAGDRGRFRVCPGQALLHDRFEAHLDRFSPSGAMVLNLPLPDGRFQPGLAAVADPDAVARLAGASPAAAAELLLSAVAPALSAPADWPDILADELGRDPSWSVGDWGERNGIAPWTVSRGFERVFGIAPSAFRARARARLAWTAIRGGDEPLAQIAARLGFADQSHMTRGVKTLTGKTPRRWRGK